MMKLFVWFLLCSVSLFADIVEIAHFHEIEKHLTPETLLVLDIDDTLIVPEQMLGCDEWFQHRIKQHKQKNISAADALDLALVEWEAIRHVTRMELCEPETHRLIHKLQAKKLPIMGLTTQRLTLAACTAKHLRGHEIDLAKTAPSGDDHYFCAHGKGILYRDGILFTAGTPKGEALFRLCDAMGHKPTHIVFVNDKASHLKEVEETATKRSVKFVGLRYAHSDARKAAFSPEVSDLQFKHSTLGQLLSDAEAKLQLKR